MKLYVNRIHSEVKKPRFSWFYPKWVLAPFWAFSSPPNQPQRELAPLASLRQPQLRRKKERREGVSFFTFTGALYTFYVHSTILEISTSAFCGGQSNTSTCGGLDFFSLVLLDRGATGRVGWVQARPRQTTGLSYVGVVRV